MKKNIPNICDEKKFEKIFSTYAQDVKRFLFFKTQNIEKTEDLLQETFIKLWENCDNVNILKLKSYLFTVANNLFINHTKHLKVVRNYQKGLGDSVNKQSPEYLMIEKEFLLKIEKSISELPDKQREVFLLSRIEKKKYKEIALLLGVSIKTVEKRMHDALKVINKKIGKV